MKEKIQAISDYFNNNVKDICSVFITNESDKTVFCLLVEEISVSILIENQFIQRNSIEQIEKIFSKDHIAQKIHINISEILICIENITIWPNDEACQKLNASRNSQN
ncbi:MAG: hypothetical protein HQK78_17710 [Desulfobacterales bacterium]|nr:hypothetical protein [Desulfobacterales bacterium]